MELLHHEWNPSLSLPTVVRPELRFGRVSSPSALRRLWQPPGRFEDRPSDRRVTSLELFFDLVFVVVISQLAHRLAEHPSWPGSDGSSSSSTRCGPRGPTARGITSCTARTTSAPRVHVRPDAGGGGDGRVHRGRSGPRLGGVRAGGRGEWSAADDLWLRTGLHDPAHRAGSIPYSLACLVAAAMFAVSAVAAVPIRYWLWAAGLVIQVLWVRRRLPSLDAASEPEGGRGDRGDTLVDRALRPVRDHRVG